MSNFIESSTAAARGSVASDINDIFNTTRIEDTYLSANRISSYLADPDLPVSHTTFNQKHVGDKTVDVAVSRMRNKLQEFDAAFYHNGGNNGGA
ncbi:hypothetical protein BCON_0238g00240 [Botryotinia convoluta]|uniref:Uncharacterized protein n=1 Tax=Botryotinia convoluta TaxID=54673 RepID=A0A4Z1HUB3_9HELO|nr:hypothetical protein BCON_0238g00240 [Botryotinia convoluta]